MKRVIAICVGVFCITMAVVLGYRLSADALAIIAGVVLGILGSIPVSLLLAWALSRRQEPLPGQQPSAPAYPPVVVVQPGGSLPGWAPAGGRQALPPPAIKTSRRFHIVGGEDDVDLDSARRAWAESDR